MNQPLVTRPPYGTVAESKLPEGSPGGVGIPLDPGIPGSSTYAKPEGDIRKEKSDDEPIKRVDEADDLAKDRGRIDTKEDWSVEHDSIGGWGKGEWDNTIKTRYPYRDKIPHQHYASAEFVAEMFQLHFAHEAQVDLGGQIRHAATLDEVLAGISQKVEQSSQSCTAALRRADIRNLRWIFSVDCGHGAKAVKLKAKRTGKVVKLTLMNVLFSCSCPAWQWLGPEHHAKGEGYLDGRPRGTATTPFVKDPEMQNKVCKHVLAVVNLVRGWEIPVGR